jgi:aminopeptidase N
VLAHQETATDTDFMRVESVIAHEYFHNWSGNRVTCRDWFQLSLKEGLTVFRDQEFSSDMHSRSVQRIDDVIHLRNFQFTEDAGPLAHPIRPDNYIEINNFYTMTVYEKGAEVIRMLHTILGPENYRKGTDLYFKRHDGQAVTCDDFVKALEDASNIDLAQFKLWYSQAGTPQVTFKGKYDTEKKTYKIELSQKTLPTPGQSDKAPMSIPVTIGLLNSNGDDITEETLLLTQKSQSFEMTNIASPPTPSILRNFSSPVKLTANYTQEEMQFLMLHDSDGFNRWEAAQRYFLRTLGKMIETRSPLPETFVKIYGDLLKQALNPQADNALIARAISLPYYPGIFQEQKIVDPDAVYKAREEMLNTIVGTHSDLLTEIYNAKRTAKEFSVSPESMGRRTLQNTVMLILSNKRTKEDALRAIEHYDSANNMTDRMAALNMMCAYDGPEHTSFLNAFYERYKSHELVVNKWFSAQAMVVRGDSLEIIQRLRAHEEFDIKNPNRVRALYAAFAMNNPVVFHQANGAGYTFLRDAVIELNTINPQIAARLLAPMREWKRYTPARQEKMEDALREILKTPNLAPDIYEITSKSLEN